LVFWQNFNHFFTSFCSCVSRVPKSITLSCAEEGAAIYYTDDGSDPKNGGTQKKYSGSIEFPTPDPDQSSRTVTLEQIYLSCRSRRLVFLPLAVSLFT
jgi:hypothetical protein